MQYHSQEEIGAEIARLAVAANVTQAMLAERLEVSQPTVSKMMSGQRSLTGRELVEVSDYFGVPASSIVAVEESGVLLRAGEAASEAVSSALELFQELIDDYFEVQTIAR